MTRCAEVLCNQIEQDERYFYGEMLNDKGMLYLIDECNKRRIQIKQYYHNNAINEYECDILLRNNETLQFAVMSVIVEKYREVLKCQEVSYV